MKRLAPLALLGLLVACRDPAPARDQWLVTVTTDAPLPQFGDRLLVEILDEEGELACPSCRRVLGIRTEDLPLSFGIAAREKETWLRVRLYRADHTGNDGFPSSEALVDALGILPDVGGVREVSLALTLDCFGRVANPVAGTACDPTTGEVDAIGELTDSPVLVAGSWWGSQRRACGPVDDDMICVEGGAFLRGSPRHLGLTKELSAEPERLTVVSPFAIDRDEVTVGEVRALLVAGLLNQTPLLPNPDPKAPDGTCTFLGASDPTNDALPVNCVSHQTAEAVCAALGRRLPTEAEWEFAAGQQELETLFPWGFDADVCSHAIVGRGRLLEAYETEVIPCRLLPDGSLAPWGPQPGGQPLDTTNLGILNLAGNVAEWVADGFVPYGQGCHDEPDSPLIDPLCGGGVGPWVVRGSGWNGLQVDARVIVRRRSALPATNNGFRCARSF